MDDSINTLIALRVRELRADHGWSLDALAERSGVSRSNIALIESGKSSPTAVVLDKLATALKVALASLFERNPAAHGAPSPLVRVAEQPVWTDPASGYVRRSVSPPGVGSPLQLVDVLFPAGQRVAYETAEREAEIHQQVWMIDGEMDVALGETRWRLRSGDCLAMRLNQPTVFHNPGRRPARYLVAVVNARSLPTRTSP
jgi:transcriptional regulator with XRE-family HTH domain